MATPEYQFAIGHPDSPGWTFPDPSEANKLILAQIQNRFNDTGENKNISLLTEAVELAVVRSEMHRETHQRANYGSLGTNNNDGSRYKQLAGRPDKIGEYIHFMGQVVDHTLDHPERFGKLEQVGLELGGILQYGDWENTSALDDMAKAIPRKLHKLDQTIGVQVYARNRGDEEVELEGVGYIDEAPKNYLILPRFLGTVKDKRHFDYALLRRRRAEADIWIPNLRPIEVFKDSEGLLVVSQLPKEIREVLYDSCSQPDFNTQGNTTNSKPAMLAGSLFERAIRE